MVGHEHEGKAEENCSKLELQVVGDLVEVHIIDFDLFVSLKQLDGLLGVGGMHVHSNYLLVDLLEAVNDGMEGLAGAAANVQEISSGEVHVVDEEEMCCESEKEADEDVVDVGGKRPKDVQHKQLLICN